ncbi:daptide-type RiPP biosynthesis methyltransferase [Lentzea sp. NBRC 102530]|uniref:daptide-type RiPP biosynthesis methyltransferase n=1 Tax=Lentzea sp. NBRC 102530 TaxID=3032201 RepID=UPI0024A25715|nr:daptide-type RiPP biosynthesis methyltransferase [Lentzea sp. NBRC 102530]GLY50315.1 hypothetical protein Lesp01_39710 [Lentzea sp. NBRC 102530]
MSTPPGTAGALAELYGLEPVPLYSAGAGVYDDIARIDRAEIGDVLRLAQRAGGPVLELACGSGRVTLPLLARGHRVVALDNSAELLRLLENRLPDPSAARLVEADMTSFALDETFGLVVLAATSVCLLDARQRAAAFERVRAHLADDGLFYVSVLDLAGPLRAPRPVERTSVLVGPRGVTSLFQHFDGRRGVRTTSVLHESVVDGVTAGRAVYVSEIDMVGSGELVEELGAAGFEVLERRSGPAGEQVQVQLVCGRRR